MTIRIRTIFFTLLGIIILWFLYVESAILTPFILAAIFAYVFNPIVNFLSHKIKLNRIISVVIIYLLIISIIIALGFLISSRILNESTDLSSFVKEFTNNTQTEIGTLPDWIRPIATEALVSMEQSKIFSLQHIFTLFPQAISRAVSFIIFIFASFYFLKEGRSMFDKLLTFVPKDYKVEIEILIRKINSVLGAYLRGQIFMIFFVSLVLFVALSILGVKFSLILAIFSGFAEIIPLIGPIVATFTAAIVVFLTGVTNFGLAPLQGVVAVIVIYTVVRQFQDYFVTPHVIGRITQLHPLIILFSVLAGEHIAGILGVLLAVPAAATIKILIEYCLDKINEI